MEIFADSRAFLHPKQLAAFTTRANEVLFGGSAGGGKALALDTPIPTPQGWTTMGDLRPGDKVFDELGKPCSVLACTEVMKNRPCYRVLFGDGSEIVADAQHEWLTMTDTERKRAYCLTPEFRESRRASHPKRGTGKKPWLAELNAAREHQYLEPPTGALRTTETIAATLTAREGKRTNHSVIVAGALTLPDADLPIDPYVLGVWLGDGTSISGGITNADEELLFEIENAGYELSLRSRRLHYGVPGLQKQLRSCGLLNNKHIPVCYLRSSLEQRMALIQGLMDTDGSIDRKSGKCEFTNCNRVLAEQMAELLVSIGIKVRITEGRAVLRGKDCGPKYRLIFTTTRPVFRLTRKLKLLPKSLGPIAGRRMIVSCEPVASVPVRCIQVDSPSHLYLAGKTMIPTHNSFLLRYLAVWCALNCSGIQVYLFRRTYPDLQKNHMEGATSLPAMLGGLIEKKQVVINYGRGVINFANGSRIFLCHCQYEKNVFNYQGAEIHLLLIDELTHFSEKIYRFLRGRCRCGSWKPPKGFGGIFPRIVCGSNPGGIGHCVPYGEVLTPDRGWVDIKTLSVGDAVYAVNRRGELVESVVSQVHRNTADKICIVDGRGFHVACTKEHKMAKVGGVKRERNAKFSLVPFKDLPGQATVLRSVDWVGKPIGTFTVDECPSKRLKLKQPLTITGVQYAALMGWVLSEGCCVENEKYKCFFIAQSKPEGREKIRKLLDDCGFKQSWDSQQVTVYSPSWWNYLKRFGRCREKYIPRQLLDATKEELTAFFLAAVDGDGHWSKYGQSGNFYTISKQFADDFQEVALKLGFITCVSSRGRENRTGETYCVSFKKTRSGGTEILTGNHQYKVNTTTKRRSDIREESGEQNVYCIGVPEHHAFVIRQKGTVWVSGNSWVKEMFVTANEPNRVWRTPKAEGRMLRQFIPSMLADNPTMEQNDPDYRDRLLGLGDTALVKAMLEGNWDIVAGGAIDDVWNPDTQIVPPFKVPDNWYVDRSFDWGSSAPFSVGWWAVANGEDVQLGDGTWRWFPPGSLIRVAEWYGWNGKPNEGCKMLAEHVAKGIKDREKAMGLKHVRPGPADSAIFSTDNGHCIAEDMKRHGVTWVPSHKGVGSRVNGLEKVRAMLKASSVSMPESPGLYTFSNCLHYIRTMPVLPRSSLNPEDVDTNSEDHCLVGDTLVLTENGWTRIDALAGTAGRARGHDGKLYRFFDCRKTREADVFTVTMENGKRVTATGNHRFMLKDGSWKRLDELREGDELMEYDDGSASVE